MKTLIKNATIINEGFKFKGSVLIEGEKIKKIFSQIVPSDFDLTDIEIVDASGLYLIPGVIDDQVHFREPGLTHKGDIYSESRAAVAGGVTTYMEMPNTKPQAVTQEILEEKYKRASEVSAANFSFYMGATNDNLDEVLKTDPKKVCGIKVFMGSSTGNMLVDDENTLSEIFKNAPTLVATHCEDEKTILKNIEIDRGRYGENVPMSRHAHIRSDEACYISSSKAVELASKFDTRLHILHLSSAKEMSLFNTGNVSEKKITAEVCVHHLWFDEMDYFTLGTKIKWNPSIKCQKDKKALWEALLTDKIDVIATDHAPHDSGSKCVHISDAAFGIVGLETMLPLSLDLYHTGKMSLSEVLGKMTYRAADIIGKKDLGRIAKGAVADFTLIDINKEWAIKPEEFSSKSKNAPFSSYKVKGRTIKTIIGGQVVYSTDL